MQAIKTMELVKQYKTLTAVDRLYLDIQQGELFSLLGVNGAGKTTTIKMLSCLTKPTSGDILVGGYSTTKEPEQVKRLIGVSPQETAVAPNLSVKENLELICGIHSFSKGKTEEKIRELSEQFALDTVLKCRLNFITRMQPLFPWAAFRSHSSKDTLLPGLHSDLFSSYPNRQDG